MHPRGTPPLQYASVDETSTFSPEILKAVDEYIDSCNVEFRESSIKIHETMFEARYAHKVFTEFMEAHGFSITPHYLGLETAWRAAWSNISPPSKKWVRTIGFNGEMDALPGIGHACGHNLIAMGGVAAALGTKYAVVLPDYAKMRWLVCAPTAKEVEVFRVCCAVFRYRSCTGPRVPDKIDRTFSCYDLWQNDELASEFSAAMKQYGCRFPRHAPETMFRHPSGSFNLVPGGNVTYELPALHPSCAIPTTEDGGNHTPDSAATKEAHAIAISVAKCIALTGLRVLTDGDFYARVRKAFEGGDSGPL
ncbi:hypothetical protein BS47DRAFT_1384609 [Hydnum rufescens UP504]|uniref:Peptidase M20 domain-containing protein 2 n=1 Tax=Hydnum rufescens UP504 TaxID=1448309 RepID=A0A9P6AN42_9AGAM|nr:hypothetical protein BS47DRAFT_1384609 [Hydnum rufescens UP504]